MLIELEYRKATIDDLKAIIQLLSDDFLGEDRENFTTELDSQYLDAFKMIDSDPNQFLMVVLHKNIVIATCHLTILPSLTYHGSVRLQIEAVRVLKKYQREGIGKWMMGKIIDYAQMKNAKIIQLTTNKLRDGVVDFYKECGFEETHSGMKKYLKFT
ncbi:MAG: GNAT family N-acetyltransferase [Legionellales bacterium]|nr:GNAT family N-acetyltransferase [Legionellales bacterium]